MSLNSEPISEDNDLLRMIDEGILGLNTEKETPISVDAEQILKSKRKKED